MVEIKITKLTLDQRYLFKKRRIHGNMTVSSRIDDFSCEGEAKSGAYLFTDLMDDMEAFLKYRRWSKKKPKSVRYGIGKMEDKISDYAMVNVLRNSVGTD
jgi:hypothetical protein